jgi:Mannosyltransferase (PIG-V)
MAYAPVGERLEPPARSTLTRERVVLVLGHWIASRAIVLLALLVVAPLLREATSPGGVLNLWDGRYYDLIAGTGYEYAPDGQYHSVAFFPLFPALVRLVMLTGLPFPVAGAIVNNVALLGALWQLHAWASERFDAGVARWATAVLAWFPYSLFATVTYTEGIFLLTTVSALRAFDAGRYGRAAAWGALATAARLPGAMLVGALLLAAWRERRPVGAYAAALASAAGVVAFMAFCALRFGDPIAFLHAQQGWNKDAIHWTGVIATIVRKHGLAADSLLRLGLLVGAGWLLWASRGRLSRSALFYGWLSLGLFLGVNVQSVGRFMYALAPLSLALGIPLSRHRRAGALLLAVFAVGLVAFSLRWSWGLWVA